MPTDVLTPLVVKTKNPGDISVNINQATPGTTNGVQVNAALPAGTNIIGKVGIDQTTIGTTNAVALNTIGTTTLGAPTAAGTSASGNILAVQGVTGGVALPISGSVTTTFPFAGNADGQTALSSGQAIGLMTYNGTTWDRLEDDGSKNLKVNVNVALPTGSNVIGAVTQSGTWNIGTVTTVSAVTAITNALPSGSNTIGAVTQASGPWTQNLTQVSSTTLGAPTAPGTPSSGNILTIQGNASGIALNVNNVSTDTTNSGTLTTSAGTVSVAPDADGTTNIGITGTWTGTLTFQGSIDGTNFFSIPAVSIGTTGAISTTTTTNGDFCVSSSGYSNIRVSNGSGLSSGSATVYLRSSDKSNTVALSEPIPAGTNVIGAITQSGTWNVTVNTALPTGANTIGAVTQSGTWNVTVNTALPTGSNTIGAVTQASGPWTQNLTQVNSVALGSPTAAGTSASGNILAVQGVTGGVAMPISGSVTTTFPFAGNADGQTALSSGQAIGLMTYNGTTWDRLEDDGSKNLKVNVNVALPTGSNTIGAVTQSGTWNIGTVTTVSAVTAITNALPSGSNTIGAVTQASGPWTQNLTQVNSVALGSPTAAGTAASGNILSVQGNASGVALPVSGTVSLGTGSNTIGAVTQSGTWNIGTVTTVTTVSAVTAITNALPSGSNTIGAVTQASGPWTQNLTQVNSVALGSPTAAGTAASGNILSIQGNASGVPVPVSGTVSTTAPSVGTLRNSGQVVSGSTIAAGSSATLASGYITSGKIGTLQQLIVASSVPCRWDLQTVNASAVATTIFSLFTSGAVLTHNWVCQNAAELATVSGNGTTVQFQVVANNEDNSNAASAYATFFWAEN